MAFLCDKLEINCQLKFERQAENSDFYNGTNMKNLYVFLALLLQSASNTYGNREMIESHGYIAEEHYVETEDGYVLKMFRIPNPGKRVVFMQHGLLSSSVDWVLLGPNKALAYMFFEAGYDVWMGNARGNTYSRRHVSLSPNHKDFWKFGWNEIGQIDLPNMINYVLNETGEPDLHYIGHSQGTTTFFVMAATQPHMNAKIKSMHALAPVAFCSNMKSPFLRALAPFTDQIEWIAKFLGTHEFAPIDDMLVKGGQLICKETSPMIETCANAMFLIAGFDSDQLDRNLIPTILENFPAGSSVDQIVHYGQLVKSGKFRNFDFGWFKNIRVYGSLSPPDYDLSKITAPVYLHYSGNDWLSAVEVRIKISFLNKFQLEFILGRQ